MVPIKEKRNAFSKGFKFGNKQLRPPGNNQPETSSDTGSTNLQSHPDPEHSGSSPERSISASIASSVSEGCIQHTSQPFQAQDNQAQQQPVTESLWKEAADGLDPKDRKSLDSLIKSKQNGRERNSHPDDVSLIISRADALKKKDKKATWRPVAEKIANGALKFKSLGDAAVKFDRSGYAALGWSVVSFGLQVAANAKKAREFVLSSSEVITGIMSRYTEYEKWFRGLQTDKEFDRCLTNVYKATLLYVVALENYLRQCNAERLARGVYELSDHSISQKKEMIDAADTEVKNWLPILKIKHDHDNYLQLVRKIETQSLPDPSRLSQDCLKSLAFLGMESRSKDIDTAAQGTCDWLLRHETYRSWVASDRGLLWIKGKPGSGKSTLLRYVSDNIVIASNIGDNALVLQFFFHGRGAELQKTPLGLFRSLLHQLLSWAPDALPDLVTTFQQRCDTVGEPDEKWQWHLQELLSYLKSSLSKVLENRSVWLFIDALDESGKDNAAWLVKELKSLLRHPQSSGSRFHICFSCRHYPLLDQDCKFEICLERENRRDISTYVHAQLSTSPMLMASFIPALITKRAEGIYMWARLVVNKALDLDNEGTSLKKIENRVNSTPPELDELYDELVRGMDERPTSLKLFQWICFAEQPLSLDELRWAIVVDADCSHRSLEQCQGAEDYASNCDRMRRRLRTLSRGLTETVPLSDTEAVQFIHQSVKDFFIEKGLLALDSSLKSAATDTATVNLVVGISHYQLSRTCIRYMAMEEIRQSKICNRDVLISAFPLLRYAVMSWIGHAKHSETKGVPQDDLLDYFAWPSETLLQLWVSVYHIIQPSSQKCPAKATQLIHVLSRYGVIGPLRLILQMADQADIDINARDEGDWTPLSLASREGHEAVVELLLGTGKVDVVARNKYGQTALLLAVQYRHEAIVKLLLITGKADIEAKDKYGRTALSRAIIQGHEAIVELLLVTGKANVEVKDIEGQTALLLAVKKGHEAIVKLLLIMGKADIAARDKYGFKALGRAVVERHEGIVRLLLA